MKEEFPPPPSRCSAENSVARDKPLQWDLQELFSALLPVSCRMIYGALCIPSEVQVSFNFSPVHSFMTNESHRRSNPNHNT